MISSFGGFLEQSVFAKVVCGPFLDETDQKTPEDSLTISNADVRVSKNGGAFAQRNSTFATAFMENGYYLVALSITDTNTVGILTVSITESGALPVSHSFLVLPSNIFDSLIGGTDYLKTDLVQLSGDTTAADNVEKVFDNTGFNLSKSSIGTATAIGNTAKAAVEAAAEAGMADYTLAKYANIIASGSKVGSDGQSLAGDTPTITPYATWKYTIYGLGDISDRDELHVVIKSAIEAADSTSIVMWSEIAESGGLAYLAGQAAGTPTDGLLTVLDEDDGDVELTLKTDATGALASYGSLTANYWIGVKKIDTDDDKVELLRSQTVVIKPHLVQATT